MSRDVIFGQFQYAKCALRFEFQNLHSLLILVVALTVGQNIGEVQTRGGPLSITRGRRIVMKSDARRELWRKVPPLQQAGAQFGMLYFEVLSFLLD